MINFKFDAQAYRDSIARELIPEGQYRAIITDITAKEQPDGVTRLAITYRVTWKNTAFTDSIFLNPQGHPYFASSNRKLGDLARSTNLNPFDILADEKKLIGCTCGIELAHKKSKDGNSLFNAVKKFLKPDETERLKEFSDSATNSAQSTGRTPPPENSINGDLSSLDPSDPSTWFNATSSNS